MRTKTSLLLLLLLFATALSVAAQTVTVDSQVAALNQLWAALTGAHGRIIQVLTWVAVVKLVVEVVNTRLAPALASTTVKNITHPGSDHDAVVQKRLTSGWYRSLSFAASWLTSLKLPTIDNHVNALVKVFPAPGRPTEQPDTAGQQPKQPTAGGVAGDTNMKTTIALLLLAGLLAATASAAPGESTNPYGTFDKDGLYRAQLDRVNAAPVQYAQATTSPSSGAALTLAPGSNDVAAAQQAGAWLDNIPGFSWLASIPNATFDVAKFEVLAGMENNGSEIENALTLHYNVLPSFYLGGGLDLGASASVVNQVDVEAGARHGWQFWEVWGGVAGVRDFEHGRWGGSAKVGLAFKPVSGVAVYTQPELNFFQGDFQGGPGPKTIHWGLNTGIAFAF